ncbi:dethiobiotin synthase [Sulfurivirga sp.]|uniref:dethiobiotin synthase n=1 Tax=Sulfurivirga sp. TaxID=2614236 RepID=UPI0025D98543|nr:dethiobiotin synthase [Sulfurivirga sp.]
MTEPVLPQQGLFVTGTDTEVGKTWVSAHILRHFRDFFQREKNASRKNGGDPSARPHLKAHASKVTSADSTTLPDHGRGRLHRACARKPVLSGAAFDGLCLRGEDAVRLAAATGEPMEQVCRFQFAAPISPARAAREAGMDTTLPRLLEACKAPSDGWTLVEGAGGFLSPLGSDSSLNADLAATLGLPVLLVARLKLGCINHTLLTLEAIEHRGLRCAGIVLNDLHDRRDAATHKEMAQLAGCAITLMPHGRPGPDWADWLNSLELVAQTHTR